MKQSATTTPSVATKAVALTHVKDTARAAHEAQQIYDSLLERRNEAIRKAAEAGLSTAAIAKAAKMSTTRVNGIIHG